MSNRKLAIARGDQCYFGRPCKYGHKGLRYTSYSGCVECSDTRQPSIMRPKRIRVNIKISETRYLGSPCSRGHDGVRYSRNGNCVACASEDRKQERAQQRAILTGDLDGLLG